jgi:hypothetical protein
MRVMNAEENGAEVQVYVLATADGTRDARHVLMLSCVKVRSALVLLLASNALGCAHRPTPSPSREDNRVTTLDASADAPVADAGMTHPGDQALAPPSRDSATPLQRELAPRPDIVSPSMQQHDNPRALAMVRCQQQERCGFVREGGKYLQPAQCLAVVREEQRDLLKDYSCPMSTDTLALQNCLEAVRAMDCAQPFGRFRELAACNPARICGGSNAAIPTP